jgi:cysteine desulfurase
MNNAFPPSVSSREVIYFDNNATTRVAPEVFEAMIPYLTESYGNPSSAYGFGRRVGVAVEEAREQVAALLHCEAREVVFTSCGTESDNAALASALQVTGHRHLVTSAVEHSAVRNQCEHLERQGYAVTYVPVGGDGLLDPARVVEALRPDTALVSLMWANNETGVVFPIAEVAALCRERGVLFHSDAVQVPGKLPLRMDEVPVDFLSLSGHKLHAPKGVGVLFARRRKKFVPYVVGGIMKRGGAAARKMWHRLWGWAARRNPRWRAWRVKPSIPVGCGMLLRPGC